jgi:molybdopterin converting factor small subunit
MARIIIPTPLRKFTNNQATIEVEAIDIRESINALSSLYPDLKKQLFDDKGEIRQFVRIYLGDEDIKVLNNEQTPVTQDAVISIVPAIAGGIAN